MPPRSEADREALLEEYELTAYADRKAFLAERLVSRSTIFRWKRERLQSISPLSVHSTADISSAVATLCLRAPSEWQLVDAIISFSSWLRFPTDPVIQNSAAVSLLSAYLSARFPAARFDNIPDGASAIMMRRLSFSELSLAYAAAFDGYADFSEFEFLNTRYTERTLLRDIAAYLASDIPGIDKPSHSLSKAFLLLEDGLFTSPLAFSRNTFFSLWKRRGASAVFHFIEQDDSVLRWHLGPRDPEIREYVDEIVADAAARREFFGKALFVTERIRARIAVGASESWDTVRFPEDTVAIPTDIPDLSHEQLVGLRSYTKNLGRNRYLRGRKTSLG